jgi:hypothetical protein
MKRKVILYERFWFFVSLLSFVFELYFLDQNELKVMDIFELKSNLDLTDNQLDQVPRYQDQLEEH